MSIMLAIFGVFIKEKKVYGSLCFKLFPQQRARVKRSTKTCAELQIITSMSCWRHYLERLMVFGG